VAPVTMSHSGVQDGRRKKDRSLNLTIGTTVTNRQPGAFRSCGFAIRGWLATGPVLRTHRVANVVQEAQMLSRVFFTAALAVATVLVLSPTREVQAAPQFGLDVHSGTVVLAAAQVKPGPGPGRCGTGKYWDKKKRACVSK
jgi:hypothetical protein